MEGTELILDWRPKNLHGCIPPSLLAELQLAAYAGRRWTPTPEFWSKATMKDGNNMAILDWSECPAVESIPGKVSGAWVFKDTRMPVATVFENLEAGLTAEEVMEEFSVTREQINAVLHFTAA